MVRNGIPKVCFYFCSTEQNSQLFSLPLKRSEGNFESLLLFWYHGKEFWVVFCSAEGSSIFAQRNGIPQKSSERNSESFLFLRTAGIPSEVTICFVYSVFRRIIFFSEIPNPKAPSPPSFLFWVIQQFCRFWIWSDTECSTPTEYGL